MSKSAAKPSQSKDVILQRINTMTSPSVMGIRTPNPKLPPDEKDIEIQKLKAANKKLQGKIKDLNITVEKTIDKAREIKVCEQRGEKTKQFESERNIEKLTSIRQKEIENSQKLVKNNQREIDTL